MKPGRQVKQVASLMQEAQLGMTVLQDRHWDCCELM
jgi:hypothetical protein